MPTPSTPTVNKLWIAKLLTEFRTRAGMSQEDAGHALYPRMKPSNARTKLAQIEIAQLGFKSHRDLEAILDLYGVGKNREELEVREWLLEAQNHTSQLGRWKGPRATFGEAIRKLIDLEEDASMIRLSGSEMMPGLLQCDSYIRALFSVPGSVEPDKFELSIQARSSRAQATFMRKKNPTRVTAVLAQSCLERYAGMATRTTMREQMEHLLDVTAGRYPHVLIQVLPNETPSPLGSSPTNFTLLTIPSPGLAGPREIAYSENPEPRYVDDQDGVATYETKWQRLTAAALSSDDSRRVIDEARLSFA